MKDNKVIVVEKERSPLKTVLKFTTAVFAIGAACAIAYKYIEKKYNSTILGRIDLDGDGLAEAIMLDTTGNGEVDTIIIDTGSEDDQEDA